MLKLARGNTMLKIARGYFSHLLINNADQLAFSLKMLELFFLVTLQITYTALIDRQNQFSIFSFLNLYSGLLANSVDPDQEAG